MVTSYETRDPVVTIYQTHDPVVTGYQTHDLVVTRYQTTVIKYMVMRQKVDSGNMGSGLYTSLDTAPWLLLELTQ